MACVLVTVISMALETPETAVSCYLVFFATKETAAATILQALKLIVGAAVGIGIGFIFFMLSANEPMLRVLLVAVFSFAGMFFAHASRLGPVASTIGFVLAFAVSLFDVVPVPELLTRGAIWMWAVVALPMAILIVVDAAAGFRAELRTRTILAEQLHSIARLLRHPCDLAAHAAIVEFLGTGTREIQEDLDAAKLLSSISQIEFARLAQILELTFNLANVIAVLRSSEEHRLHVAKRIEDCAASLIGMSALAATGAGRRPGTIADILIAEWIAKLEATLAAQDLQALPARRREPLLASDAFTSPDHLRFALKGTLAVLICYVIYTSTNWFGIHTALVTCFFVSLSTVGETLHKLTLRIAGCLIGAALGVASILILMPSMEDIGHLGILVGIVASGAAWIATGNSRISYMGWQIALAFFLCVLHGYGPTLDLLTARDRVLGILLGNIVVTIVFTQLWPVSVVHSARAMLSDALRAISDLALHPSAGPTRLGTALMLLSQGHVALGLKSFEPGASEIDKDYARRLDAALASAEMFGSALFVLSVANTHPDATGLIPEGLKREERLVLERAGSWLAATVATIESGSTPPALDTRDPKPSCIKEEDVLPLTSWVEIGSRLDLTRAVVNGQKRLACAVEAIPAAEVG